MFLGWYKKTIFVLLVILGTLSLDASLPSVKAKQLENFPVIMSFKAFLGVKYNSKKFQELLKLHKYVNWIHSPGNVFKKIFMIEKTYPDKIITLQDAWGGTCCSKNRYKSWPGYWLYESRTILLNDIGPDEDEIIVDAPKRLARSERWLKRQNRRIKMGLAAVIYRLKKNGKPNFDHAEQVGILKKKGKRFVIKRHLVGGKSLSFRAGKAAVALHVYYWTNQWQLNMSLDAPKNPANGMTAPEWYAQVIAERVKKSKTDGVEFDVARWTFSKNKMLDCNNDGIADFGYINGINSFGLGGQIFLAKLRKLLGKDKIIQMDSNDALTGQRGWNYVNGIQMEAFPMSNHFDRFSEAFQYLRLWTENVRTKPALSYAFTKTPTTTYAGVKLSNGRNADFRFRMGLAADVLLGMPHPFLSLSRLKFNPAKDSNANKKNKEEAGVFLWDEYLGGNLKKTGWLGKPTGPLTRHDRLPDKVNNLVKVSKIKIKGRKGFVYHSLKSKNTYEVSVMKITEPLPPVKRRFGVRLQVPLKKKLDGGKEYTLSFEVQGDDRWSYKGQTISHVPRSVSIRGVFDYEKRRPASTFADSKWRKIQFSFVAGKKSPNKLLEFGCSEQIGTTRIRNIRLVEGAYGTQWSRRFEHGLVLLNASNTPRTFKIPSDGSYRRLKGIQDPTVNNGRKVGNNVLLPAKDALFLIKTK